MRWRSAVDVEPVIGPVGARRRAAAPPMSSTSRKYEKTTTLRPLAIASRAISSSRVSLAESRGSRTANAARRMAMKLPSRTAAR